MAFADSRFVPSIARSSSMGSNSSSSYHSGDAGPQYTYSRTSSPPTSRMSRLEYDVSGANWRQDCSGHSRSKATSFDLKSYQGFSALETYQLVLNSGTRATDEKLLLRVQRTKKSSRRQ